MSTAAESIGGSTMRVLGEVARERRSVDALDRPIGEPNGAAMQILLELGLELERAGMPTWADALFVDLIEAIEARTLAERRRRLLRAAAHVVAWVETIDRQVEANTPVPTHLQPQRAPWIDAISPVGREQGNAG